MLMSPNSMTHQFSILSDHALLVSGIEFNDDFSNATVNLIDPGSGDFSKGYELAQFEDAWADSDHFMVSII